MDGWHFGSLDHFESLCLLPDQSLLTSFLSGFLKSPRMNKIIRFTIDIAMMFGLRSSVLLGAANGPVVLDTSLSTPGFWGASCGYCVVIVAFHRHFQVHTHTPLL